MPYAESEKKLIAAIQKVGYRKGWGEDGNYEFWVCGYCGDKEHAVGVICSGRGYDEFNNSILSKGAVRHVKEKHPLEWICLGYS